MAARSVRGSFDTNVLLRFVLNDVSMQTRTLDALLTKGGAYYIEDAALIEMVFVLEKLYHMPRAAVVDNLLVIIDHEQLVCSKRVFERALPAYVAQLSLSFMDCMLLAYARVHKQTPLYTFDKALIKHADGDACDVAK